MNEPKNKDKGEAHRIMMVKLNHFYNGNKFNINDLARLIGMTPQRAHQLIRGDGHWSVEEWFLVMALIDKPSGMTQLFRYSIKKINRYQASLQFRKIKERFGYE